MKNYDSYFFLLILLTSLMWEKKDVQFWDGTLDLSVQVETNIWSAKYIIIIIAIE